MATKSPVCKFCGRKEALRWAKLSGGRYKMYEVNVVTDSLAAPHECPEFIAAYSKKGKAKPVTIEETPVDGASENPPVVVTSDVEPRLQAVEARTEFLSDATSKLADAVAVNVTEAQEAKERIAELAREIDARRVVEVRTPEGVSTITGLVHRDFAEALKLLSIGHNLWLHGNAGTFKTTVAAQFAEALFPNRTVEERFFPFSVSSQTSKSDILGFVSPVGEYIPSALYLARKNGGLLLADEIDAGNPNVLTGINAAVENDVVLFPNGELVKKHPDFYVVAAANTVGSGADDIFLGRLPIDGATKSRFAFFNWEADWPMVATICESIAGNEGRRWAQHVERIDNRVRELKVKHAVGPRAAVKGAELLAGGVSWERAENARVYGAMRPDDVAKIQAGLA